MMLFLLQAKAHGDAHSTKNVDLRCRVIILQQRLAERLQMQSNGLEVRIPQFDCKILYCVDYIYGPIRASKRAVPHVADSGEGVP